MDSAEILARNLERIRIAKGYTQENLALDAGVSRSHIGNIKGLTHSATLALVDRLAAALDVQPWMLLAADLQVESVDPDDADAGSTYPPLPVLRVVKTQQSKRRLRG